MNLYFENFIFNLNIFISGFISFDVNNEKSLMIITSIFISFILFFTYKNPFVIKKCKNFSKYQNNKLIFKHLFFYHLKGFLIIFIGLVFISFCLFVEAYYFSNDSLFIIGQKNRNSLLHVINLFLLIKFLITHTNIKNHPFNFAFEFLETTSIKDEFKKFLSCSEDEIKTIEDFNSLTNNLPEAKKKNKLKI